MRSRSTTTPPTASSPQALREQGFSDAEIGTHAGAADTSLALAVDQRLVRIDAAARRQRRSARPKACNGDPRRSSAAAGRPAST